MQWLPTKSEVDSMIQNEAKVDSFSKFKVGDDLMKFVFTINSTSLSSIYIHPRGENVLNSWSFSEDLIDVANKTYLCSIANGLQDAIKPFKFEVTLKLKSKANDGLIDVTLVTLENDENNFSNDFRNLINRFPSWTFPVPLVAKVNSYTY